MASANLSSCLFFWFCIQVKKYKFPTEKDMKHINRKLKSCWGHSSHDEYFPYTCLYSNSYWYVWSPPLLFLTLMIYCLSTVKSGRRNQNTSPIRVQMKCKMAQPSHDCKFCFVFWSFHFVKMKGNYYLVTVA